MTRKRKRKRKDSLTLKELLKKTGLTEAQVKCEIQDLVGLAQWFDGDTVEDLIDLEEFKLTPDKKSDISNLRTTGEKAKSLLKQWKQGDPYEATFERLLKILLKRGKGEVAKNICEYLKTSDEIPFDTDHSETATEQPPDNYPGAPPPDNNPPPPDNYPRAPTPDNNPPPPDNNPPPPDNNPTPPDNNPPPPDNQFIKHTVLVVSVVVAVLASVLTLVMLNSGQSASCVPRSYPCEHNLTLTNFEQLKEDHRMWYFPAVYTHPGGYRFCLGVTPNGELEGNGTHVTVAVFFMKGEFDHLLKWPFQGNITFQLVDQLHGVSHKEHSVSYDESVPEEHCSRVTDHGERASLGWGVDQFIKHIDLTPRYLINDTLKFQITMVDVCM